MIKSLVLLLVAVVLGCKTQGFHELKDVSASPSSVQGEAEELVSRTKAFWIEKVLPEARKEPGFPGVIDKDGKAISAEKQVTAQARIIIGLSYFYKQLGHRLSEDEKAAVKSEIKDIFEFIFDRFYEANSPPYAGYILKKSADGSRVVSGKKMLYAQSFILFAFSSYAEVFPEEANRSLSRALDVFASFDGALHDNANLGYIQSRDGDYWATHLNGQRLQNDEKDHNSHMHLLESLTILNRALKTHGAAIKHPQKAKLTSLVYERLKELSFIFSQKIVLADQSSQKLYAGHSFSNDWKLSKSAAGPYQLVNYGHNFEIAHLALDALTEIRESQLSYLGQTVTMETMKSRMIKMGLDTFETPGVLDQEGIPYLGEMGRGVTRAENVWWPQAEALVFMLKLYASPDHKTNIEPKLKKLLQYMLNSQLDKNGGWFEEVKNGVPHAAKSNKAHEWKAMYHCGRAVSLLDAVLVKNAPAPVKTAPAPVKTAVPRPAPAEKLPPCISSPASSDSYALAFEAGAPQKGTMRLQRGEGFSCVKATHREQYKQHPVCEEVCASQSQKSGEWGWCAGVKSYACSL